MEIKCPHCGANYEVTEDELGTTADCMECGRTFVVGQENAQSNAPKRIRIKSSAAKYQPVTTIEPQPPQAVQQQGLRRYFTSKGRASRKEFWISLFLPIPFTGLLGSIRRLHDLNKCEWWLLAPIACIIAAKVSEMEMVVKCAAVMGYVWLIILGTLNGTLGDNDYGPDPKGRIGSGRKTPAAAIAIPILTVLTIVGVLIATLVNSLKGQEKIPVSSTDTETQDSHDTSDMVTIDGVMIRRLPDTEFTKVTDENGNEMFSAVLPEKDGFTPGVHIWAEKIDFDSMPITARQMKSFTHQDIREFMDGYIPNLVKELEGKGLEVTIGQRSGNAVSIIVRKDFVGYQKNILDTLNGRLVYVCGVWNSDQDKEKIKVCVDSARLAAQ